MVPWSGVRQGSRDVFKEGFEVAVLAGEVKGSSKGWEVQVYGSSNGSQQLSAQIVWWFGAALR